MYRSDSRIGDAGSGCRQGIGFRCCIRRFWLDLCVRFSAPCLLPLLLLANACTGPVQAPVIDRETPAEGRASVYSGDSSGARQNSNNAYHQVARGDTLYSIAWRYDLDYRNLAAWNGISEPYLIYPGQKLRLTPAPRRQRTRPAESRRETRPAPTRPAAPSPSFPRRPANLGSIDWQWPTAGELVNLDTPIAKKGVNISGSTGQAIKAAANGHVVYSGSGLLGYGKLIIIKHNDIYLSAYAHNDEIFVNEGDRVVVGQKIATMGLGGNGEPLLHFEIRKDGKPVSPLSHLPQSRS